MSTVAQQHPAWWLLRGLNASHANPSHFINVRAIKNIPPDPENPKKNLAVAVYNENIPIMQLKARWEGDLLQRLALLNAGQVPVNIYYGVNPRTSEKGNLLKDVPMYHAFYLDCDVNKEHTLEDRWRQILFWIAFGLPPSLVIFTGHGFHVYWFLNKPFPAELGAPILREVVRLSGCKDKGNTFDSTRVLRLPGFNNTKAWWTNDTPPCTIVYPEDWAQRDSTNPEHIARYDPNIFTVFPPSDKASLIRYTERAAAIPGEMTLDEKVVHVARLTMRAAVEQQIQTTGVAIAAENVQLKGLGNTTQTDRPQEKTIVPAPEDIPWRRNRKWMKKYCQVGYAGLRQDQIDEIAEQIKSSDTSASAFDFKIMLELIIMGYTYDAIKDFWTRADTKLHRPEKAAKNPGYFDMTYGKAMEVSKNILDQAAEKAVNTAAKIREAEYMIVDKSTQTPYRSFKTEYLHGEKYIDLMNCHLRIEQTYENPYADGEETSIYYALTVTLSELTSYTTIVPRNVFSSPSAMRDLDHVQYYIDATAPLQFLLQHLLAQNPHKIKRLHDKMLYANGYYDFPYYRVTSEGIEETVNSKFDKLMIEQFVKKNEFIKACIQKVKPREEVNEMVRRIWRDLITLHRPEVILPIFGLIGACAVRPLLEDANNVVVEVPTVNLRGNSSKGKSHTAKLLMQLCGFKTLDDVHIFSVETSVFAFGRLMASTNLLPLTIDEFKENTENNNRLEAFRSLVRRIYTGETLARGRADLSYTIMKLRGTLMVIGEHPLERVGNVAEVSRILPVDVYEHNTNNTSTQYARVSGELLGHMNPYFYHFILQQDPAALYAELRQLKAAAAEILPGWAEDKNRIAPNVAIIQLGIRLWDRFVQSIDPNLPAMETTLNYGENIIQKINEYALRSRHTVTYIDEQGNTVLKNRDDLITFLSTIFEMENIGTHEWIKRKENNSFIFDKSIDDNTIYVKLTSAHEMYSEYCKRTSKNIIPLAKIERALDEAPAYMRKRSHVRWLGGKTHRTVALNLEMLTKMKVYTDDGMEKVQENSTDTRSTDTEVF